MAVFIPWTYIKEEHLISVQIIIVLKVPWLVPALFFQVFVFDKVPLNNLLTARKGLDLFQLKEKIFAFFFFLYIGLI